MALWAGASVIALHLSSRPCSWVGLEDGGKGHFVPGEQVVTVPVTFSQDLGTDVLMMMITS